MKINFAAVQDAYAPQPNPLSKGPGKYFCLTCKKTLSEREFFKTGRKDKYPAGILPHCKTCVTMGVNDTDPATFLPILKEINIPYMPGEWRALLAKKDARGASILGKYVSKMRLNQYKKYSWVDTERLVASESESILAALRQETDSESEAEEKFEAMMSMQDIAESHARQNAGSAVVPDNMVSLYGLTPQTSKYNLTQEEINELKLTWGDDYTEDQYLQLEQLFTDMRTAYVIHDPIAISNAKMISKMTVKMNKFLDIDDVESASKMSRQLDLFIKTANLAPVQQKDRQQTTFAISQMAFLVEREGGFIPTFYMEKPNDKIDQLLRDMENYTQMLVTGESQLGSMIENAQTILAADDREEEEIEDYDDFAVLEQEILGELEPEEEDEDAITS